MSTETGPDAPDAILADIGERVRSARQHAPDCPEARHRSELGDAWDGETHRGNL